jgi:hypothetical protein
MSPVELTDGRGRDWARYQAWPSIVILFSMLEGTKINLKMLETETVAKSPRSSLDELEKN